MANLMPDGRLREREVVNEIFEGRPQGRVRIDLLLELIAMEYHLKNALSFPDGKFIVQEPGKIFDRDRRV
jgi:hypothetical protein